MSDNREVRVERYDHPLRWLAWSDADPKAVYIVDLSIKPPSCTCRDFTCRHAPKLRQGFELRFNCCKHIRRVVQELMWEVVEKTIELYDSHGMIERDETISAQKKNPATPRQR